MNRLTMNHELLIALAENDTRSEVRAVCSCGKWATETLRTRPDWERTIERRYEAHVDLATPTNPGLF